MNRCIMAMFDTPFKIGLRRYIASASAWISLYPDDGTTVSLLMRTADQAMFHTKKQGGHQFSCFSSTMQVAVKRKAELLRDIQLALDHGHLYLMYQPLWLYVQGKSLKQKRCCVGAMKHAEVLVRQNLFQLPKTVA